MVDHLDPDFDQRTLFIQPQAQAFRAAYRSPISSEDLNLHYNSVAQDIQYLYDKLDQIDEDLKNKFELLYEIGSIYFSDDATLKTIHEYAVELKLLRQEIQDLK